MSLFVPPACIERIRCRGASACSTTSQKQKMNLSSSLRNAAASGCGQLCSAISSAQLRSAASATAASPAAASSSEPPDGSRCTAARSCRTASANDSQTYSINCTNAGYASQTLNPDCNAESRSLPSTRISEPSPAGGVQALLVSLHRRRTWNRGAGASRSGRSDRDADQQAAPRRLASGARRAAQQRCGHQRRALAAEQDLCSNHNSRSRMNCRNCCCSRQRSAMLQLWISNDVTFAESIAFCVFRAE